jgi:hypothetical protein
MVEGSVGVSVAWLAPMRVAGGRVVVGSAAMPPAWRS